MSFIGNKFPIIALHGFTGSGADFDPIAKLAMNYLEWFTPDLPGHGSNESDCLLEIATRKLNTIAAQVDRPFILLGYSMGGRLALNYAINYPDLVKGLILIGVSPGIENPAERLARKDNEAQLAGRILRIGVKQFLEEWRTHPLIKTQELIPRDIFQAMLERREANVAPALANSLLGMGVGSMEPLWSRLGELKCPVYLITGEKDLKFEMIAKKMIEILPEGSSEIVPDAGHAAHLENIPYFLSLLEIIIEKLSVKTSMMMNL